MVRDIVRPPFMLYVAWHPGYANGKAVAERLLHHFGAHRYRNIVGGAGVTTLFRSVNAPASDTPLPIEWDDADATAVVVLMDRALANDQAWTQYVRNLSGEAKARGLGSRVLPIAMEAGALDVGLDLQALRWDQWGETDSEPEERLLRELTYEFSRMLRRHLARLQRPDATDDLEGYLRKVNVFLSHSKHDADGEPVAVAIRDWLHGNSSLSSFLDVYDIPAGMPFAAVMDHSIQVGVLLAVYTDSYSSRPWCRHEVIEAKRNDVPILVVDCLQTVDERALPYLGNVPVIRMNPDLMDRIELIAGSLLDEVFKNFLWQCRVERLRQSHPQVMFMARPPEMISLSSLPHSTGEPKRLIVYPDPPLSTEESCLLSDLVSDLHLYSLIRSGRWRLKHDANGTSDTKDDCYLDVR